MHTGAHFRSGDTCPDAACEAGAAAWSALLRGIPWPTEAAIRSAAATESTAVIARERWIDAGALDKLNPPLTS